MSGRISPIGVMVLLVLLMAGCGVPVPTPPAVPRDHPLDGLPNPSDPDGNPPTIRGHIAYQLPFLPIDFSINNAGEVKVAVSSKIVTLLGTFSVAGGAVQPALDDGAPPADVLDVTELIICPSVSRDVVCTKYEIGTGRKIRLETEGRTLTEIERTRFSVYPAPGTTVRVIDAGPPTSATPYGSARIAIHRTHLHETSPETEVDLEAGVGGYAAELGYDHVTGEIKVMDGTRVALRGAYSDAEWDGTADDLDWSPNPFSKFTQHKPVAADKLPGENECLRTRSEEWRTALGPGEPSASATVYCVKTNEGDLGYLVIRPAPGKPIQYHVYSRIWVR